MSNPSEQESLLSTGRVSSRGSTSATVDVDLRPLTNRQVQAEKNQLKRRWHIASLAAELFNRQGYHQTTMEHIAQEAGIAKPTLYHYFASKSDILLFIHDEFMTILINDHESRVRSGIKPAHLLLETMVDMLRLNETRPGHFRIFVEHFRDLPEADRQAVLPKRDYMFNRVQQIIADGIREGTFRPVDEKVATMAIFGMCNWAYQWFKPGGGPLDSRGLGQLFWDYISQGLLREDSPARGSVNGASKSPA